MSNRRALHITTLTLSMFCAIRAAAFSGTDSLAGESLPFNSRTHPIKGMGFETNLIGGRIIRHSAKFTAPVPAASWAVDVNIAWHTWGRRSWQQDVGYPLVGAGLVYSNYCSPDIFGRCLGAYPYVQIPLIRNGKFEWTYRFGVGLGYVTRTWRDDTINTAVSTHLNAFAICMTDLRWHISEHLDIQAGVGVTHISNALYREPNLGVNMWGLHTGLRWFPVSSEPDRIVRKMAPLSRRWLLEARGGVAHREARAKGNPVKPAYVGALSVSKRVNRHNKVFAGVDAAYHEDVHAFLLNYGVEYGQERQHSWDGGFFVGDEYLLGRLGLMAAIGVYYRQTFLDFDPVYQKMGGKYYLYSAEKGMVKEFFVSALLNTHGAVAEYAEFGMGLAF